MDAGAAIPARSAAPTTSVNCPGTVSFSCRWEMRRRVQSLPPLPRREVPPCRRPRGCPPLPRLPLRQRRRPSVSTETARTPPLCASPVRSACRRVPTTVSAWRRRCTRFPRTPATPATLTGAVEEGVDLWGAATRPRSVERTTSASSHPRNARIDRVLIHMSGWTIMDEKRGFMSRSSFLCVFAGLKATRAIKHRAGILFRL